MQNLRGTFLANAVHSVEQNIFPSEGFPSTTCLAKDPQRRILSERTLGKDTQQKIFPNLIAGVRVLSFDYFGSPWTFENLFPKLDNHSAWGCI